jgi:hypothetical protein
MILTSAHWFFSTFDFVHHRHQYAAHLLYTTHYIRTPTFTPMTEPCFASYTSPISYVIYNGQILRRMEHRSYHAYAAVVA